MLTIGLLLLLLEVRRNITKWLLWSMRRMPLRRVVIIRIARKLLRVRLVWLLITTTAAETATSTTRRTKTATAANVTIYIS